MAVFNESKDRNVIPNFRNLRKTAHLGELNGLENNKNRDDVGFNGLPALIQAWQVLPNLSVALDLLNYVYVLGEIKDDFVHEAACYVLKTQEATELQKKLARKILKPNQNSKDNNVELSLLGFILPEAKQRLWGSITAVKHSIRSYPLNPFSYVELGRLYSIVGQKSKSISAMQIAVSLAPYNRYVLRSLVRVLVHFHEEDIARFYLNKNPDFVKSDPWVLATDIALSTLQAKTSRNIKKGVQLLDNWSKDPFHTSELASSLATEELISGNRRKSRQLFNKSLIKPNDNSLAQIEWANSKDNLLGIDVDYSQLNSYYEAKARDCYLQKQWEDVIDLTQKWFIDQPFSKTPILMGSNVAGSILEDNKAAIQFCEAGLLSHPNDPQLLNNTAYYLALDNHTEEALDFWKKINIAHADEVTILCAKATRGLIHFRMHEYNEGKALYMEAIDEAYANNQQYLYYVAFLNYAREELIREPSSASKIHEQIEAIPDGLSNDIDSLKKSINQIPSYLTTV